MRQHLSLVLSDNGSETVFPLEGGQIIIGRSSECDIVIQDPYISRRQARIFFDQQDQVCIENLGRNPIQVNGMPIQQTQLQAGDVLRIGSSDLVVQSMDPSPDVQPVDGQETSPPDDGTVFMAAEEHPLTGPHLAFNDAYGHARHVSLAQKQVSIGRGVENHVQLEDQSVSRGHAVIEDTAQGLQLTTTSETNPVFVNSQSVATARIYAQDLIQIGPFHLTCISDRPQDQRPAEVVHQTSLSTYHWAAISILVLCVCIFGGYFAYTGLYQPWQYNKRIQSAATVMNNGNSLEAMNTLHGLLQHDLSQEQETRAQNLLADAVLTHTKSLMDQGDMNKAKSLLMTFMQNYGAAEASQLIAKRLDRIRLETGRHLESTKDYERALKEYAAVRDNGPLADEARNGIRRIWLASQQKHLNEQNIAQLLQEAEQNFIAKRYLTPVNNNAYAPYQAVLSMDPDNEIALQRIEQMKAFYRKNGERYFQNGRFARALTYFERYAIIDPDNAHISERISACRSRIGSGAAEQSADSPSKQASSDQHGPNREYQEQVQKMLDESGAQGSRIMKYLFEDPQGEKDTDSPW